MTTTTPGAARLERIVMQFDEWYATQNEDHIDEISAHEGWDAAFAEHKRLLRARPIDEWHEDIGDVLWWFFPIEEPPYCGTPNDSDWPGSYLTHWSMIPIPFTA
jgi:hypothetical protein